MTMAGNINRDTNKILSDLFRKYSGRQQEVLIPLKGDASARRIYRLQAGDISAIGVHGPNNPENKAFLGFTRSFDKIGLPVPEILAVHSSIDYYLLEDLGDETLFDRLNNIRQQNDKLVMEEIEPLYRSAIEHLAEFQLRGNEVVEYSLCYQTREFDESAWKFDHKYFLECFIDLMLPDFPERSKMEAILFSHRRLLQKFPRDYFLYRDFQSRNIMIKDDRLNFIDYQSGRKGWLTYDIASLLYDARADLPDDFRMKMFEYYSDLIHDETGISKDLLSESFPLFSLLRILQALGSYGNNGINKGKTEYLTSIPFALKNAINLIYNDSRLVEFAMLANILQMIKPEKSWENQPEAQL